VIAGPPLAGRAPGAGAISAPDADRIDALEQLGRSFKATMAAVRRLRGRETHHPGELSFAQYSLLFGLGEGGARSARELACAADLSPATVTQMLDSLAAAGLVQRIRSDVDKRVVLTSLTDRGQGLVAERRARFEPLWRRALLTFDDHELRTAAAVLDSLGDMFYDVADRETAPG
jgi:MarR family transcriptional regulator, organic hydroperoxide resistance regulator